MIVVDASLAAKWFLKGADSEQARAFFRKWGRLFGPEVLTIEVSRALVAAANSRRLALQERRRAIAIWLESIASEAVTLFPMRLELIHAGSTSRSTSAIRLPIDCTSRLRSNAIATSSRATPSSKPKRPRSTPE